MSTDKTSLESISSVYDVIIVGGGIAGLAAAHWLKKNTGAKILLLEALDYPGGRIRTVHYGKQYAEAGAMVVTAQETETVTLLDEFAVNNMMDLGPNGVDFSLGKRFVHLTRTDGRITRSSDLWALFRMMFISAIGGGRELPFSTPRLFFAYRKALQALDQESQFVDFPYDPSCRKGWDTDNFSQFLDRFHPDLRHFIDLQLKVTSGELSDKISMFWGLVTFYWNIKEKFCWLRGGTSQLPEAIAARLGNSIQLNSPVHSILPGDPVRISHGGADKKEEISARTVIIATPPPVTLKIVNGLEAWKRDALSAVPYGVYIPVHLRSRRRFWEKKMRAAYLNCSDVIFADLADATRGQDGQEGILTAFLAGPEARAMEKTSDSELLTCVYRDIERLFPGATKEIFEARVFRWTQGITYFPTGYAHTLQSLRRPQGNIFFCGEYTQGAGVNDAVVSGQIAAQEVLNRLGSFIQK